METTTWSRRSAIGTATGSTGRGERALVALWTSPSSRPSRTTTCRSAASTESPSPTSQVTKRPDPPAAVTSSATDNITVSGASNLGPSNPLLIGFVPGVNSVGLSGSPSRSNPFSTPSDPFCVPVDTSSSSAPVTGPTPGQKYAKNPDGTYVCDPNTVPQRAIAYRSEFGLAPNAPVPVDAVTASGSGLDPDISVANATLQAPTVARARHLPLATVRQLIAANTTGRSLGVLGDPGVNVLTLNLALDAAGTHGA